MPALTAARAQTLAQAQTLEDLIDHLGSIPPSRILLHPAPGTATEADVLQSSGGEQRLCELVDGVLVEKPRGMYESRVAAILIQILQNFLDVHNLGIVLGEAGTLRLAPGLIRIPDVCFLSWDHFPNRKLPRKPIPDLAPDLAVEVLSESNTAPEMQRKLEEYFASGTRLVWYVQPNDRTVRVYHGPEEITTLGEDDTLDGGDLLPGFRLSIREWFERAGDRQDD